MTKTQVYRLIDAEIEWCRNDPENKNIQEDFRNGFIEGLTQAKRLIRAARFMERAHDYCHQDQVFEFTGDRT